MVRGMLNIVMLTTLAGLGLALKEGKFFGMPAATEDLANSCDAQFRLSQIGHILA